MTAEYEQYLRTEWNLFSADSKRAEAVLEVTRDLSLSRVLDIGCGAGQELIPFASRALCVGIDSAVDAGVVGRQLFATYQPQARVMFARATAEQLPFQSNSFDAIVCRLALPYTDNKQALSEMARVLRPGGVLFLKIHHARYYLGKAWKGLRSGEVLSIVHAMRVLLAGLLYHATGKQPRMRLISPETFQTRWLLDRELSKLNLSIDRELAGSNALTPSFLIKSRSGEHDLTT
jgi:SAM-dependent methyltransferase